MDNTLTIESFLELLKAKKKNRGLREFAAECSVSFQFLSKVISGACAPGPKLAAALGYEQVVAFKRLPRKRKAAKK
jgi:hypothetical protein